MPKKIIAGNWKMNKSYDEGTKLVSEITKLIDGDVFSDIQIVIAPPFIHLYSIGKFISTQTKIVLGAQNCYSKSSGAYTGEVSAAMLKSVGVQYVILGHSERREHFKESNEFLKEKVDIVLEYDLKPIFCCGETLDQREKDSHIDFVCNQITGCLFHLSPEQFSNIVIAYEPIWAIGTGKNATSRQAQEMHKAIRGHIAQKFGSHAAESTTILYGGSCKSDNAKELFACPDVDGGLIGGASLNAKDFVEIVKSL